MQLNDRKKKKTLNEHAQNNHHPHYAFCSKKLRTEFSDGETG